MTLEVKEWEWNGEDEGFIPLIQLLTKLHNIYTMKEPLSKTDSELLIYKDIHIAHELLKFDEQLAIQIANVIRTHTGK